MAEKKTDRRTLYTKMAIKDALLALMEEKSFDKLTVTAVCRQAEITRATFYLHFDDLTAVLNELLEDALHLAEAESADPNGDMLQMLQLLASGGCDPELLRKHDTLLPACQRVADLPKYRPMFLDSGLSEYIIKKLFQVEKVKMVPILMEQCRLPKKEAEMLFAFVIYGAFAVNKSLGWQKNQQWYEVQGSLIRFILGGMEALSRTK